MGWTSPLTELSPGHAGAWAEGGWRHNGSFCWQCWLMVVLSDAEVVGDIRERKRKEAIAWTSM